MPKGPKGEKRPADINQLAKMVVDIASGENIESDSQLPARGRAGGLKGGAARAAKLTPDQRSQASRRAATKRWGD